MDAAVDFTPEQARGFKHAQVLGDGRERDVEGSGKFGDGSFAAGQPRKGAPCGIWRAPRTVASSGALSLAVE